MWQHHAWRGHPRDMSVWVVGIAIADKVGIGGIRMRGARGGKTGLWGYGGSSGWLCGWGLDDGCNSGRAA